MSTQVQGHHFRVVVIGHKTGFHLVGKCIEYHFVWECLQAIQLEESMWNSDGIHLIFSCSFHSVFQYVVNAGVCLPVISAGLYYEIIILFARQMDYI